MHTVSYIMSGILLPSEIKSHVVCAIYWALCLLPPRYGSFHVFIFFLKRDLKLGTAFKLLLGPLSIKYHAVDRTVNEMIKWMNASSNSPRGEPFRFLPIILLLTVFQELWKDTAVFDFKDPGDIPKYFRGPNAMVLKVWSPDQQQHLDTGLKTPTPLCCIPETIIKLYRLSSIIDKIKIMVKKHTPKTHPRLIEPKSSGEGPSNLGLTSV